MASGEQFRIWCVTESAFVFEYKSTVPTQCPNDAGHTIDSALTVHVDDKTRIQIMNEAFDGATSPAQADRMIDALNKRPSVIAFLDNHNYVEAEKQILAAKDAGDLLQEDYDLIMGKFPTGWNN